MKCVYKNNKIGAQLMLSIRTMHSLAEYLIEAVISSVSLQPYRQCLASIIGFNGTAIFHHLDRDRKGYLISKDFSPLIQSEAIQDACQRIFSQIDSNNQKRVNRLQFVSYLLPRENVALRQIVSARMKRNDLPEQDLHFQQQLNVLSRMFEYILRTQSQKLSSLRKALLSQKDYSIDGVVSVLDCNKKGWIEAQDIQKFIRGQGIPIHIRDIYQLIQMYDHNMDGKLMSDSIVRLIQFKQKGIPSNTSSKKQEKAAKQEAEKPQKSQQSKKHGKRGKVVVSSQKIYPPGRECLCNKQWVTSKESTIQPKITARKTQMISNPKTNPYQNKSGNYKATKATPITKPTTARHSNSNSQRSQKADRNQKNEIQTNPFEYREDMLSYDKNDYSLIKTCELRKIKELQRAIKQSKNCLQTAEKTARINNSYIKNKREQSSLDIKLANQIFHYKQKATKFEQEALNQRQLRGIPSKINFLNTIQSRKIPIQYVLNRNQVSSTQIQQLKARQYQFDRIYGRRVFNRISLEDSFY